MAKITIVDGNDEIELSTAPKENIKAFMVKGERGTDGISPTVNATKVGKVTTLEITDKNGTRTTSINDGFDPTVTATKVQDTTTVSITDINGTRTTEIYDGRDLTGGVPADGVIGWDSDDLVYICDGTETGDYYLTYNSTDYYFTMPTVEDGDGLLFNTTSLELSLNGTTITTSSSGTGTELTFTDYVPNGYELTNPIPTVVDTYSTSTTDGYSANYLNDKLIKDETTIKNLIIEEGISDKNLFDGRVLLPITYAGLTYSPQNDGSIVINGTKYGADLVNFKSNFFILKAGTYTLSTTLLDGSVSNIKTNALYIRDYGTTNVLATLGYFASSPSSITFTLASDSICYISFYYGDNIVFNNAKIAIQIEKGNTSTNYVPYKAFESTAYVLWTNPNPTSSFAGKTVTLNDAIGNYRYYEIIYHYYSDGSSGQTIENRVYQSTGKLVYGKTRIFTFDEKTRFRNVELSGTSATFGNGATYSTYGSSSTETTNFVCIPYQILGYK